MSSRHAEAVDYAEFTLIAGAYARLSRVSKLSALPSPDDIGEYFACTFRLPSAHVRVRQMRSPFRKVDAQRPDEGRRRSSISSGVSLTPQNRNLQL